jgi:ariadne-1
MELLQSLRGAGLQEVQFLLKAVNSVIACRRVLQWTYVYGFYLPSNSKDRVLFESHQQRLEQFTEKLHGYVTSRHGVICELYLD